MTMYAGDEFYDDDVTSGDDGPDRCVACDGPLPDLDIGAVCDECSGLAHCVDDICWGAGLVHARQGCVALVIYPGKVSSARESGGWPPLAPVCKAGVRDTKRGRRVRAAQ